MAAQATNKQAKDAQNLYDDRADKYDDSHHPRFARHMVELVKLQPGEHVLDLACGTGLATFEASAAVGTSGAVVGIDTSRGMLAQAEGKMASRGLLNVSLYEHSILDLDSLGAVKDKQFDVIICCSALVLFSDPQAALRHWVKFLKPGGRLIVDVTHPQNTTPGVLLEKVGYILGRNLPWYRLLFEKPGDLSRRMEAAGLKDVNIKFMSQINDEGTEELQAYIRSSFDDVKIHKEYNISDADSVFDKLIDTAPMAKLASPADVRQKARDEFKKEWAKAADPDGKVREVDGIWVGIGWKA